MRNFKKIFAAALVAVGILAGNAQATLEADITALQGQYTTAIPLVVTSVIAVIGVALSLWAIMFLVGKLKRAINKAA